MIPQELVDLVKVRRVIPFVGAGFSIALGLPTWEDLLEEIRKEVQPSVTLAQLESHCNKDFLQLAEYFYILSDRSIGPLRHVMSRSLALRRSPVHSGAHVDLINLGTPQVYTTNYDEAVENAYHRLNEAVDVVALPKHVATLDGQRTQVVKFHGDLRHDQTLVLTESSYYARLDFESPMDLKFRSDILGKSVLFMGYGFSDINIRIIWFKLMRMMKDIRPEDRPKSYMITFADNPVRETLYDEVGIKTIVLGSPKDAGDADARTKALAEFINQLAIKASDGGHIPGTKKPQFVSTTLIQRLNAAIADAQNERYVFRINLATLSETLSHISLRRVPDELKDAMKESPKRLVDVIGKLHIGELLSEIARFAKSFIAQIGASKEVSGLICICLIRNIGRRELFSSGAINWRMVWSAGVSSVCADIVFQSAASELRFHREGNIDQDLAYIAAIVARLSRGEVGESEAGVANKAKDVLAEIIEQYPEAVELETRVLDDDPTTDAKVLFASIEAAKKRVPPTPLPSDDIPF